MHELDRRREETRLGEAAFIERQRIKREQFPWLWDNLTHRLKADVNDLNKRGHQLVITNEKQNEVVIQNKDADGLSLIIDFSPEAAELQWSCGAQDKDGWQLGVSNSGRIRFERDSMPETTDAIAQTMLRELLGL